MTSKRIKRFSKAMKRVYCGSSSSSPSDTHPKVLAQIPVFQLPHKDLSTIPEHREIHEGFFVNMSLEPHLIRRFSGLKSLSNPDQAAIERSAATEVEFRSFSCLARAAE